MVGNSLFKKGSNSNFLYLLALVMSIPTVDGLFLSRIFSAWVSFNDLFFDLGFGSRVQVLFPRMQCTLRVINLGFDPFNYDRYNRYFGDNSALRLAQAGTYMGAKDIEEYLKFGDPDANPFINPASEDATFDSEVLFLEYDRSLGQCIFLINAGSRSELNADLANGETIETASSSKVFFDYENRYIANFHIYLYEGYINYLYDTGVNTTSAREYVCSVLEDNCQGFASAPSDCVGQLAMLPTQEASYIDGNSFGCRVLHSFLALENPEQHCPHVSLVSLEDPDGAIKCQASSGVQVSELFTEDELAKFDAFAEGLGIDPEVGYTLL